MARHQRRALLTAIAAVVPLMVVMPVTVAAALTRIRCHDGDSCDSDQTRA